MSDALLALVGAVTAVGIFGLTSWLYNVVERRLRARREAARPRLLSARVLRVGGHRPSWFPTEVATKYDATVDKPLDAPLGEWPPGQLAVQLRAVAKELRRRGFDVDQLLGR